MRYKSVNRFEHIIVHTDLEKGPWVPLYPGSWFQPLMFDCTRGGFAHLLKVNPGRMLAHFHPSIVHGFTLQGQWRYLENDWIARPGTYINESAGEVHTLCVDPPVPMITFFYVAAGIVHVDETGKQVGYDDGFTLLDLARKHYRDMGINMEECERLIR
jgi:hypothetical protein